MNKVAEKMRSLGVADAADEIERLERSSQRRRRAAAKLTAENNSLRAWVLELQMDAAEKSAIGRLIGIVGPCQDTATLRGFLDRTCGT